MDLPQQHIDLPDRRRESRGLDEWQARRRPRHQTCCSHIGDRIQHDDLGADNGDIAGHLCAHTLGNEMREHIVHPRARIRHVPGAPGNKRNRGGLQGDGNPCPQQMRSRVITYMDARHDADPGPFEQDRCPAHKALRPPAS